MPDGQWKVPAGHYFMMKATTATTPTTAVTDDPNILKTKAWCPDENIVGKARGLMSWPEPAQPPAELFAGRATANTKRRCEHSAAFLSGAWTFSDARYHQDLNLNTASPSMAAGAKN